MIELKIANLKLENNSTELDFPTQNSICGGLRAANSITDYGSSTSSFNITQFEAGDTDFVVNQVNTVDNSIDLPFKNRSKILNYINIAGSGVVTTEGT